MERASKTPGGRAGTGARLLLAVAGTLALAGCQALAPQPQFHPIPVRPTQAILEAPSTGGVEQAGHTEAPDAKTAAADRPLARLATPVGARLVGNDQAEGVPAAKLAAPVIPPPEREQVIDLIGVLSRAGIENPTIALAEEAVRASEAARMQARSLLLPSLNAGMNARFHQGNLQGSAGIIRDVNIQSFYVGGGALAATAGTVEVPGIRLFAHLGDAYYAPQAAEQQVVARSFDAVAVRQRTLLEVGVAYLQLAGAQARLAALARSQEDLDRVVQATANFAKVGQGRDSDARRARAEALLLEQESQKVQEEVATAAAELARLLDLDPSVRLLPADAVPPVLDLVDLKTPLPALLQSALATRPEIAARSADVATAQIRVRQERVRPWLPLLTAGYSAGGFGGAGSQSTNPNWSSGARLDADVAAIWTLQNAGMGNRALQRQAQAGVGIAEAERVNATNLIRTEVVEALTLAVANRRSVDIARQRVESATKAFQEDLNRTRNLVGLPIEVLRSLNLLSTARVDLVRAMVGYSEAQMRLLVALGKSPSHVAA